MQPKEQPSFYVIEELIVGFSRKKSSATPRTQKLVILGRTSYYK